MRVKYAVSLLNDYIHNQHLLSYPDKIFKKDIGFSSNFGTSNGMQNQRCSLECGEFAGNRKVVAKFKKMLKEAKNCRVALAEYSIGRTNLLVMCSLPDVSKTKYSFLVRNKQTY